LPPSPPSPTRRSSDLAPPPAGWEQVDGERRWRLARRGHWRTLARAASTPAPLPALAAVGDTDEGVLLLNLERLGVTVLRGAPERSEEHTSELQSLAYL